jgi:hypothetical protein
MNRKKKGGKKVHALLPLDNMVPGLNWFTPASNNEKDFMGQLNAEH